MVRRPDSFPEARRAMREALNELAIKGEQTPCAERPVPYTEVRQSPADAKALCEGCPVIKLCEPLGFTESVYADDMVYGGYTWRRGLPVVSETAYQQQLQQRMAERIRKRQERLKVGA